MPSKHKIKGVQAAAAAAAAHAGGRSAVSEAGSSSIAPVDAGADGTSASSRTWGSWLRRVPAPAYTIPAAVLLLVAMALGLGIGLPLASYQRTRAAAAAAAKGRRGRAVDGWPSGGEADLGHSLASFFVVGDWGRRGSATQQATAQLMEQVAQRLPPDFVISTGDNFYPHGLTSSQDSAQFRTTFSNVYSGPGLAGPPWYAVLGNHDYGDGIEVYNASIIRQCLRKTVEECRGSVQCCFSPEWQLQPASGDESATAFASDARWHQQRTYNLSFAGGALQVLFIDTNPFIHEYYSHTWALNPGGLAEQDAAAQRQVILRWLQATAPTRSTSSSTSSVRDSPWRIVVGHHPLASHGGDVGKGEELQQVAWLKELLLQHHVPLYLNGHEHNLELVQQPGSNLYMATSGAGSDVRPLAGWGPGVRYQAADQGFLAVRLFSEHAVLEFYVAHGELGASEPDYAIAVPRLAQL